MRTIPALALLLLSACSSSGSSGEDAEPAWAPPPAGPGQVESFDGVRIAYDVRGAGLPALVFVHGWACDRTFWREQLDAFAEDHLVVALDLGGHGESGRLPRATWTLEALAQDVEAVVRKLDLQEVVLVGHSMGGPVCLIAARLMRYRVVGVVGLDALHDVEAVFDEGTTSTLIAGMERDFIQFTEAFARGMFLQGADAALVEDTARRMATADRTVGIELMRSFTNAPSKNVLATCPVPVYCINSGGMNPTRVESNRKYAPTFDAVVMDGVGHFLMLERPDEVNAALRRAIEAVAVRPRS